MPTRLSENRSIESPELDFTGCVTLNDFYEKVGAILVQASGVHQRQHITAEMAASIVQATTEPKHPLLDDHKALIVSTAIFPDDEDSAFYLRIALSPNSCHNLEDETQQSLLSSLRDRGYPQVVQFIERLLTTTK